MMTEAVEKSATAKPSGFRFGRFFERIALLVVWFLLIAVYGASMPQSFLTWGNFAIYSRHTLPPLCSRLPSSSR